MGNCANTYVLIAMHSGPQPPLTQLFVSFSRLGGAAFGGPSMAAYILEMVVDDKHRIGLMDCMIGWLLSTGNPPFPSFIYGANPI